MNADIEVIFHFNDNRTPCEGFRLSHLIDDVYRTTVVHHYFVSTNIDIVKNAIDLFD